MPNANLRAHNPPMPHTTKKLRRKRVRSNPAERLFVLAFGRKMSAAERTRFIMEKPLSLKEIARRAKHADNYGFLRQT